MTPDDPRHGTTRGWHAGCRDDCCRLARNRDAKRSKIERAFGRTRTVPAIGTQRRIRALYRLGWTSLAIANAAGWSSPEAVSETLKRTIVRTTTATRIAAVYDRISMRPGPSRATQRRAERAGWPPPLAWDDDTIDDPDSLPDLGGPVKLRDARVEDVEFLLSACVDAAEIARRLGTTPLALERQMCRAGRYDLARAFYREAS